MLSWKPLQSSSGFRLYCKAIGLDINDYEKIGKELSALSEAKKPYTECSKMKDENWRKIIEASRPFVGVIESVAASPCSMCLATAPIRENIGMIKTKASEDDEENITLCCLLDGGNCDKYKYLKNDYLTVKVWYLIEQTCRMAGIKVPTIDELDELLDDKTYEIYEKGLTCTINQADSNWATNLIKTYKPRSVAEMSAFVAVIRPGCASFLEDFINRKIHTTNIPELDDLLKEGSQRLLYQELIMKYLVWLGIPETGSYDIIKKIAKKKFKEPELKELKAKLLDGWTTKLHTTEGFEETWQAVEDAAHYSFNASHSLAYAYDSLYGAYLKSHYPLEYYTVALNMYNEDAERTARLTEELQYFKITLKSPKFGHSKSEYVLDRETNTIYKGCKSIKYVNEEVPNALYELAKNNYKTFSELLGDIKQTGINSRQLEILIKLDFFDVFGNSKELMILVELFDTFKWGDAKQISKDKLEEVSFIRQALDKYCTQTEKKYIVPDKATCLKILNELESQIKASNLIDYSLKDKIQWQQEYLGYTSASGRKEDSRLLIVKDIAAVKRKSDGKQFGYGIIFQSIGSGKQIRMTALNPVYKNCGEIKKGDVIYCIDYAKKGAYYNITKYKKIE